MTAPTTTTGLWLYVLRQFGVRLPHGSFTPGHSTPFRFVTDAFFHPNRDMAAWANRSGLKTLSASIIAALEFRFSDAPLKARVLSGSEDQARNLYQYWSRWCDTVLADRLKAPRGKLLTTLTNGDLEILSASQKRVRGAKVQRLFRDEVDEIDPEVLGASVGMLASEAGAPARTVDTSTWHRSDGPMGRMVAEAAARGIRLHKWNIWESLARCPVDRHDNGRGCLSCRLAGPCLDMARRYHGRPDPSVGIAAGCDGLLPVDDAIKQLSQWSLAQWQAEAECLRPSPQGLVYPGFDRMKHIRQDLAIRPDLTTCRAIDWGWNDFVCLWIQADKGGSVYVVDEHCSCGATTADNARAILQRHKGIRIEATYCDPAGASRNDQTGFSDVEVFRAEGIECSYAAGPRAREVRNGINLVRSFLQPACGWPRLFVAGRCTQVIRGFESYRSRQVNGEYVDEPMKPQPCDHVMDALRYYFVNARGAARAETRWLSYA